MSNGITPLIAGAGNPRNGDIVRLFLEKGANVAARMKDGRTALTFAKGSGGTEIVSLLENAGAKE